MIRRPPRSTRTDTLFPTRRSSDLQGVGRRAHDGGAGQRFDTLIGGPGAAHHWYLQGVHAGAYATRGAGLHRQSWRAGQCPFGRNRAKRRRARLGARWFLFLNRFFYSALIRMLSPALLGSSEDARVGKECFISVR